MSAVGPPCPSRPPAPAQLCFCPWGPQTSAPPEATPSPPPTPSPGPRQLRAPPGASASPSWPPACQPGAAPPGSGAPPPAGRALPGPCASHSPPGAGLRGEQGACLPGSQGQCGRHTGVTPAHFTGWLSDWELDGGGWSPPRPPTARLTIPCHLRVPGGGSGVLAPSARSFSPRFFPSTDIPPSRHLLGRPTNGGRRTCDAVGRPAGQGRSRW